MFWEATSYWFLYAATFVAIGAWESCRPRRDPTCSTVRRWRGHGIVLLVVTLLLTTIYRLSPVLLALRLSGTGMGVLRQTHLPNIDQGALALVLLDLTRYVTHRAYHALPWLWRFHQVHHSDPDFDVSTGARVHPVEAILTQGSTLAAVAVFGTMPLPTLIFELATCVESCFGHANVALPRSVESVLRTLLITPDMHRIHHSEQGVEQRKNFGDLFPWWDHLFGTYLAEPKGGYDRMVVGLRGFQTDHSLGVPFMLLLPFRGEPDDRADLRDRA